MQIWSQPNEIEILPIEASPRVPTDVILMVSPDFFDVEYAINTHMEGNIGTVDSSAAQTEWETVHDALVNIGQRVEVMNGADGLPDHVFIANTALLNKRDDVVTMIQSRMFSPFRRREVDEMINQWAKPRAYNIIEVPAHDNWFLEGMGDVIWHPGREFLYGGFGHRTTRPVLDFISETFEVPLLALELVDDRWYHLDVAFAPLNVTAALVVPQAFTPQGVESIRKCFDTIIELDERDALNFIANGFSPDQKHFITQQGSSLDVKKQIEELGITVIELDTSEFIKAGGSVYCMKLEAYL